MVALRRMNLDYSDSPSTPRRTLSLCSARGASLSEWGVRPDDVLPRDRYLIAVPMLSPCPAAVAFGFGLALGFGGTMRICQRQIMPRLLRSWQRLCCWRDLRVLFKQSKCQTFVKRPCLQPGGPQEEPEHECRPALVTS